MLVRGTVGRDTFILSSQTLNSDMVLPLSTTFDGANNGTSLPLTFPRLTKNVSSSPLPCSTIGEY
jgi:hypothetical protein